MDKKYKLLLIAVAFIVISAATAILSIYDPRQVNWLPKCIFFKLSGIYCPGCGATRALYEIIHGNIMFSLRNNLLLFPLLITAALLAYRPSWGLKPGVAITVAVTVTGFMLLRNLPFYPFTLLAPLP